jgi:ribosomal protein L24
MSRGDRVRINSGLYEGSTGEVITIYISQKAALVSLDKKHVMVRLDLSWLKVMEKDNV